MTKRELLQRIELMPHEAEVEIPGDIDIRTGIETSWDDLKYVQFVDGKIRLS